jgi:hypothetical protein
MESFKIKFTVAFTSNDTEFKKYKGISKINMIMNDVCQATKGQNFLSVAEKETLPANYDDIKSLFYEDFKTIVKTFEMDKIDYEILNIKPGRTPVPYVGETYQYDVKINVNSVEYICIKIFDNGSYLCYTEKDKELKTINTTAKAVFIK